MSLGSQRLSRRLRSALRLGPERRKPVQDGQPSDFTYIVALRIQIGPDTHSMPVFPARTEAEADRISKQEMLKLRELSMDPMVQRMMAKLQIMTAEYGVARLSAPSVIEMPAVVPPNIVGLD